MRLDARLAFGYSERLAHSPSSSTVTTDSSARLPVPNEVLH